MQGQVGLPLWIKPRCMVPGGGSNLYLATRLDRWLDTHTFLQNESFWSKLVFSKGMID